jgi:peptide/nickel transport system permease protein
VAGAIQHGRGVRMFLYTVKRILYVTPVALGVSIFCFLLVHLAPGDPLTAIMPVDATADQQAEMRAAYGFDKPLPVQYAIWLWKVLHGDLGN